MEGTLKFLWGHWWLFRITKAWSENRQQVENFQFLVSELSIARQNAVSQRNNILTDRNFIWFCGKNQGDTISLIKCSTVHWWHQQQFFLTWNFEFWKKNPDASNFWRSPKNFKMWVIWHALEEYFWNWYTNHIVKNWRVPQRLDLKYHPS